MTHKSGISDKIAKYATLTPTQIVEQLHEDWESALFRRVAIATFDDNKYYLTAEKFSEFVNSQLTGNMSEAWQEARTHGTQPLTLHHRVWGVLEAMASGDLKGNAAKESLWECIGDMHYSDATVVLSILDKTWRCGVTQDTINKAIPGTFRPVKLMLANKLSKRLGVTGKGGQPVVKWPMLATIKYDGFRGAFSPRTLQVMSRNGNPYPIQPRLRDALIGLSAFLETRALLDAKGEPLALDMELFAGSWKETAEARKASIGYSKAIIFGVMPESCIYGGTSEPYEVLTLFTCVEQYADYIEAEGVPVDTIRAPWVDVAHSEAEASAMFASALAEGHEGLILRPPTHPYKSGRSDFWLKMKAEETEDLPIVGTRPADPRSRHAGLVGSVEVLRDGVVSAVHGMSDKVRREITEMGDEIKGLLAEVNYHELTPDRCLRHGVLKKLRYDKPRAEHD